MKKVLIIVFVYTIISLHALCNAGTVTASISSENSFTNALSPTFGGKPGYMNVSVSGTWTGTVTLQRSFQGGAWVDVINWTANTEKALQDFEPGVQYRIGIKTLNYSSGTAVVRLSN